MALETEEYTMARQFTAGIRTCNVNWCQKDDAVVGLKMNGSFKYVIPVGEVDSVTIANIEAKIVAHDGAIPVG